MSTGAIVGIIIAVIVVAAVVVLGPPLLRQMRMRRQFGPEYDRLAKEFGSRKAVAELTARQRALRDRWSESKSTDTESLRETLLMYRAFLNQLTGPK